MDLTAILVRAEFILMKNVIIFSLIVLNKEFMQNLRLKVFIVWKQIENTALFKLILLQAVEFPCHDHTAPVDLLNEFQLLTLWVYKLL